MENHLVNGGLGSIISDIIAKYGLGKKLIKLGLQGPFMHTVDQKVIYLDIII